MGNEEEAIILLVDDNEVDLALLRNLFRATPYCVECASGAVDALRRLTQRFRIVITDLNMPQMNGFEFARHARTLVPHLTIILCTGDDSVKVREAARDAGIAAVFRKPLRVGEVMSLIDAEMGKVR